MLVGVVIMLFGIALGFVRLQDDQSHTTFEERMAELEVLDVREPRKLDAAAHSQLNFQTPATEIMEKIVDLHNDLFFFIVVVVLFVS